MLEYLVPLGLIGFYSLIWINPFRLFFMVIGLAADNNIHVLKALGYGTKLFRYYLMSALFAIATLDTFERLDSGKTITKYGVIGGLVLLGWLMFFYTSKWETDKLKSMRPEPDPNAKGLAGWFARKQKAAESRDISPIDKGLDIAIVSKGDVWLSPLTVGVYALMLQSPSLAINSITEWLWWSVQSVMAIQSISTIVYFIGAGYAVVTLINVFMPLMMYVQASSGNLTKREQ